MLKMEYVKLESTVEYVRNLAGAVDAKSIGLEIRMKDLNPESVKEVKKEIRHKNIQYFKNNLHVLNLQHQFGVTTENAINGYFVDLERVKSKSQEWEKCISNQHNLKELLLKIIDNTEKASNDTDTLVSIYQYHNSMLLDDIGEEYVVDKTDLNHFLSSKDLKELKTIRIRKVYNSYFEKFFYDFCIDIDVKKYIYINEEEMHTRWR